MLTGMLGNAHAFWNCGSQASRTQFSGHRPWAVSGEGGQFVRAVWALAAAYTTVTSYMPKA